MNDFSRQDIETLKASVDLCELMCSHGIELKSVGNLWVDDDGNALSPEEIKGIILRAFVDPSAELVKTSHTGRQKWESYDPRTGRYVDFYYDPATYQITSGWDVNGPYSGL